MVRDDDIEPIPAIVPKRDGESQQYATARGKGNKGKVTRRGTGRRSGDGGSGGGSLLGRLVLTVALVVAAVGCAWAYQLQQQLQTSNAELTAATQRISDLEDLLSDTDETVNQSATAMRAQLKLLDTEVRKLWDARKVSNRKIAGLKNDSKKQGAQVASLVSSDSSNSAAVKTLNSEIAKLKGVAGDLERLASNGQRNQAEVERVADALNRFELDNAKLSKRVEASEEFMASVNASRRQVNTKISQLEASVRALQNPAP